MLRLGTKEDVLKYGDEFFELAKDQRRSGYPTYDDGIKTKADFLESVERTLKNPQCEFLIQENERGVNGWIEFHHIPENQYLKPHAFNIKENIPQALEEFYAYLADRCPGVELYMDFPEENQVAIQWLEANDFKLIEKDLNHSFFFADYELRETDDHVIHLSKAHEEGFKDLCRANEADTYWTAQRILDQPQGWTVYLYVNQAEAKSCLCIMDYGDGMLQIFRLEPEGAVPRDQEKALLTACLNEFKEKGASALVYFHEENLQDKYPQLPFKLVGGYRCYIKKLASKESLGMQAMKEVNP